MHKMTLPDFITEEKSPASRSKTGALPPLLGKRWFHLLLLGICGFLVRTPSLQGEFLWDDAYLARDNPFIKSPRLILECFKHHLFLDSLSSHYRPVQNLSMMLDYIIWNNSPYGFHLTNLLLHVSAGVLLYFLLSKLLPGLWKTAGNHLNIAAFLVALTWIVHPVHSAAVDYISGRADSLAFLFAASAWLLALSARNFPYRSLRYLSYITAMLLGLAALCSRETALIWMVLFLLHLFAFDKEARFLLKARSLTCCLVLLATYAGLHSLPQSRAVTGQATGWSGPTRAVLMLRSLGDYGRLLVFPSNLHMERTILCPHNYLNKDSWRETAGAEYLSIVGLSVLLLLVAASYWRGKGQGIRIFGVVWFLAGYLPISNLIDLNATVAEHWLYLPSVGLILLIAGCALELPVRYSRVALASVVVATICLSVRSLVRSTDWVTEETFYQRTYACGGMSTRVALNLGQIYAKQGHYADAEGIFRKILLITPDYPIAQTNLAEVLSHEGKKKESETLYAEASTEANEARKDYPRTWIAALSLARIRHNAKDDATALTILDKARKDYPNVWELISLEADILRQKKESGKGLELVEAFVREHWWHHGAMIALGKLYAEQGDAAKAEAAFRGASTLDVHDVEALDLMAMLQVRQNHLAEACRIQEQAVGRQPDQPRQYLMLSQILQKMGQLQKAAIVTEQVAKLEALAGSAVAVK